MQPKIELDRREPILLASFFLPYEVVRNQKDGQLHIQASYKNPTMLYATLEHFQRQGKYNFHWIGIINTVNEFSEQEKQNLSSMF